MGASSTGFVLLWLCVFAAGYIVIDYYRFSYQTAWVSCSGQNISVILQVCDVLVQEGFALHVPAMVVLAVASCVVVGTRLGLFLPSPSPRLRAWQRWPSCPPPRLLWTYGKFLVPLLYVVCDRPWL